MKKIMKTLSSCALLLSFSMFFVGCFNASEQQTFNLRSVKNIDEVFPIVILGGGVAGLTAANYLAQANIPTILIEGDTPGGALMQSHSVRNWPGVLDLPGAIIMGSFREQAEASGVRIIEGKVSNINLKNWPYEIELESMTKTIPHKLKTLTCIIATGAEPNYLDIPGETGDNGYWGRGVTNCAVCDGPLYKNLNVAIVGGGDAAIAEASYLSSIAKQVTIFVRGETFRAKDHKKRDEVLALPNVTVQLHTKITEVIGDDSMVTHIKTHNSKTNTTETIPMDGVFLAIGSQPNTALFKGQLELDKAGHLVLNNEQQTAIKGIFAAGDVCDPIFRQAVTSAGQGCKAALQVQKFLDDMGFKANRS